MLLPKDTTQVDLSSKTIDMTQTGPSGSCAVEFSPAQLRDACGGVATLLADKAQQEAAAGNTTLAQELFEQAQYAAECAQTFGQCVGAQVESKCIELAKNSPIYTMLQELGNRPETQQTHPALTEPKYNGIVQEWCAQAGCKVGDIGVDVLIAVIAHKAGGSSNTTTTPTISPCGQAVAANVLVADEVAISQGVKTTTPWMAAGNGPEQFGGSSPSDVKTDQKPSQMPQEKPQEAETQQRTGVESGKVTPEGKTEVVWDMPTSGKKVNERYYTKHALERMAPDTPQVRAELESRAIASGYQRSSEDFKKYVQPRNIPPSVVENVIQNGTREINREKRTLTYILDGVKVVTNSAGDVITVHRS